VNFLISDLNANLLIISSYGCNLLLSYVSKQYMGLRKRVFLACNLIPTCHKNVDVTFWQFLPRHATAYVNNLFLFPMAN